jgi:predicted acetyltransferase
VSVEIAPCRSVEELADALVIGHYFGGGGPDVESAERFARNLPFERMHAVRVDGEVVGGGGAFPFRLTVPGGTVRAGGVTVIGVLPTHTRRGLLTALMRAQLDDMRERGEHVAYLWASDDRIYGRYGYGIASFTLAAEIVRDRAAFAVALEPAGRTRIVPLPEALPLAAYVYERVALTQPGMFARSETWWETRALFDVPERRASGAGAKICVVYEVDGRAEGYAIYRVHQKFEEGLSVGYVDVQEAMGATPDATAAIWRFLLGIDWMHSLRTRLLPVDHPLLLVLAEPRRLQARVGDGLWVRLVDVGEALAARSYRDAAPVVIEVADGFCPWNEGRWRVAADGVERTEAEPDLRCDVRELGSAYLGGFTWGELVRAGRVEEVAEGGAARADALVAVDRAPWCPEIF